MRTANNTSRLCHELVTDSWPLSKTFREARTRPKPHLTTIERVQTKARFCFRLPQLTCQALVTSD